MKEQTGNKVNCQNRQHEALNKLLQPEEEKEAKIDD